MDPKTSDDKKEWEQISLPTALKKFRDYLHVAHCMLWFKCSKNSHQVTYTLMQLRFDGLLGFPGGIVDEDVKDIESIIDALQREMHEEINFADGILVEDYFYSYFNTTKQFVSHFFAKEITSEKAEELERTHSQARDFPRESLGLFRVPIGCSNELSSIYLKRFLSNFMQQKFSGNVKNQILHVCEKYKIMGPKDIEWTKSQL